MKTNEQIHRYLESRPWYDEYCSQVRGFHGKQESEFFIGGYKQVNTIVKAFPWRHSQSGMEFWQKENDEFVQWFMKSDS